MTSIRKRFSYWWRDRYLPCLGIFLITMNHPRRHTLYPKKYALGFVVLCFVVVMQSFIMNSYEVFIHIHQGCFAGTGAIVRLPQCQWSTSDGYGKISQCITTTKHCKAKTVCIFLGIYCTIHHAYHCHLTALAQSPRNIYCPTCNGIGFHIVWQLDRNALSSVLSITNGSQVGPSNIKYDSDVCTKIS